MYRAILFLVLAVGIGVLSSQNAFAFGGTISDSASCTAAGGNWQGMLFTTDRCFISGTLTVNAGETLNISGVDLFIQGGTVNVSGTLNNNNFWIYMTNSGSNIGKININSGGLFVNYDRVIVGEGCCPGNNPPQINIHSGGIFHNAGTIELGRGSGGGANGTINNSGNLANFAGALIDLGSGNGNNGVLVNQGIIENSGSIDIGAEGASKSRLVNNAGTITNHGSIYVDLNDSLKNNLGTIINFGTLDNLGAFDNFGTVTNNAASVFINRNSFTNVNSLVNNGGLIDNYPGSGFVNTPSATISNNLGTIRNNGPIVNQGTINNSDRFLHLFPSSAFSGPGSFTNIGSGRVYLSGAIPASTNLGTLGYPATVTAFAVSVGDTLTINPGLGLTIPSGKNLTNFGTINNMGGMDNFGTVTNNAAAIFINANSFTNVNSLVNNGGLIDNYPGTFFGNDPGATISNNAGTIRNNGPLENHGLIANYAIFDNNLASSTIANFGTIKHVFPTASYVGPNLNNSPSGKIAINGTINSSVELGTPPVGFPSSTNTYNILAGDTLTINSGKILDIPAKTLNNAGTINNRGTINSHCITVSIGGTPSVLCPTTTNSGLIDNLPGSTLSNGGSFTNTGLIQNNGLTQNLNTLQNSGTIRNINLFSNIGNLFNSNIFNNECSGILTGNVIMGTPVNFLCALSINDISMAEGNSGTTTFSFIASLNQPSNSIVKFDFNTADSTATSSNGDYVSNSNTLTIPSGTSSVPIMISVIGDPNAEPDETFFVNLLNPVNATISDSQGLGTILNDDVQAQCLPGSFSADGFEPCTPASPGHFVGVAGAISESECPVGFFQPLSGQISCNPASLGHYVPTPAAIAETPASPGHYVDVTASQTQTPCGPGTYNTNTGSTSSSACILAPPGSFATGPGASFATHCSLGTFSSVAGSIVCTDAPAGSFVDMIGATTSTQCPVGQFQPLSGQSSCDLAEPGHFVNTAGSITQTECAPGYYQPASGQNQCIAADPGFFVPNSGSPSQTQCPAGTTSYVPASIACVPLPPVAQDDTHSVEEDGTITITLPDTILENDVTFAGPLSAIQVSGTTHGALILNPDGTFTYTPNTNYNGADSFTYKASDGSNDSNIATVQLTVVPINDPPTATSPQPFSTNEDTPITGNLIVGDPDFDLLRITIENPPTKGTAQIQDNGCTPDPQSGQCSIEFTYTPNPNQNGNDQFQIRVTDGNSAADSFFDVFVEIQAINDPPVAQPDSYGVDEDTTLTVPAPGVLGNDSDADGDGLGVILDVDVLHGTLNLAISGNFVYTPNPNFNGVDTFVYRTSDGQADSAQTTVTITVNPVNDPPVATDDGPFPTNQDIPIEILSLNLVSNDSDGGDGGPLVITGTQNSQNGNAVFDGINNKVIFTPSPGFTGTASFEYVVSDGTDTDVGLVTVNVVATAELFCGLPESAYSAVIDGTPGNDNLSGTSGNDLIRGFGGNDKLKGKAGDDCLIGGDGKDKIWGGKGHDTIQGNNNDDKLFGGEGNDSILGGDGKDKIWGGKGIDNIQGNAGDDKIHGNQDNDNIQGNEGNDWIGAGIGDDIANGGEGNDKLFGKQGADTLNGDSGDDRIHGGQGNDNIDGGSHVSGDRCKGGSGTNSIVNCEDMVSTVTEEDDEDDSEEDDE